MKKVTTKLIALICIFAVMIPFIAVTAGAAKVGDVVGYAQPTDIVATINGYMLESYNVDGYTYICVEDLRYYGFDVVYDNPSRTLSVQRSSAATINPQIANPSFWSIGSNNKRKNILYTDIVTYVNGSYVGSCNINGRTIIRFDSLGAFGGVSYDDNIREISLVVPNMNYNPIAEYAAYMNKNSTNNPNWKTVWRAKGDLLMLVGTSRSYMDSARKSAYINDSFANDKADMHEIYNHARSNGFLVSSVYIEVRNSDGTVITYYQTK